MPTITFQSENEKYGLADTNFPPPSAPGTSKYKKKIRWAQHTPASERPALNARSTAAEVPIMHLKISPEQRTLIEAMYHPVAADTSGAPQIEDHIFGLDGGEQIQASAIMAQYGLDASSRERIGDRWSQQWSRRSDTTNNATRKILYLCACGYDHHQRNTKYDRQENTNGTQERHTGAPFTGCLAHAEITLRADKILRIRGHFDHNNACKAALLERVPPIPVHPSVYAVALAQLRDGAAFSDIRRKNRELLQAKAYKDFPADIRSSQFRWLLTQNDSRALYRQYNRMKGVTVTDAPHINVNEWLDPQSDKFNPTLAHAVFHYSGRAARDERFEVAIATDEMNRAAWKYGHDSQIILDGTFGICDSRLLLFIVMAVDENRKGVPVAFLIFSAPGGNKQTSAGYDTKILSKLVGKWSESLNKCGHLYGFAGVVFRPLSAITDTDLKERGALIIVFPDIWLLICRFHLRQSWRNHRNKLLKGKSPEMLDFKHRMTSLEVALVATQTIESARELLQAERKVMIQLAVDHKRAARRAIKHIDYLDTYWTTDNLWKSWSDYGRTVLSSLLNRAAEGVIPTTNHLESFNRVLKRVHLHRWQNGGRRLRVDILIHALIIYILPSIFEERQLISEQSQRVAALIRLLPGGALLLDQKARPKDVPMVPKVAYLMPDADRDLRATELLQNRQISAPACLPGNVGLTLTCYSARALSIETAPVLYTIRVGFNGVVSCTCNDFMGRGGACKHIRGSLLMLDGLRQQGMHIPQIPIPQSLVEAQTLQADAVLTITIPAGKGHLPTSCAAQKMDDILQQDDTCFDDSEDTVDGAGTDDNEDNVSVATNESSDSDSESDSDSDGAESAVAKAVREQRHEMATQNLAALGEQAISRTIVEFRELESKFTDLGEYLDQRTAGLSSEERAEIARSYGHLAALMTRMDRVMALPSTSPLSAPAATPLHASPRPSGGKRKLDTLLPPSPEKMQKRHQSHAIH